MKPWLQKKTKEYDGRAKIVAVDGDRSGDVFKEYEVSVMPTFVLIKDGEEVGRLEGADKEKIEALLEGSVAP